MAWSGGVFTRTNGTYSGASIWTSDRTASVKIQSSRHDTHDYDLASGINACVAKDGSNTVTILNLSGTVNSTSGIIKVGSVVLASTYGTSNAFFGGAGNFTMTGTNNNGVGPLTLTALTSGIGNSGYGGGVLQLCTTGSSNAGAGNDSLSSLTTGSFNAGFGLTALSSVTTGSYNFGGGFLTGVTLTTGSHCVVIGAQCDLPSASASGQLSLQNALYGVSNTGTGSTLSTGNLGVYVKAPTARLHLIAGTATAGTAPLKLTAGTNLSAVENGAFEYDGTNLYFTTGGVRKTVTLT